MFLESRGVRLHYRRWWVEHALGVVVIAHGLGEHSGRYRHLARALNAHGYSVYALDHAGHGQSEGRRGDIKDFSAYAEDLACCIRLVRHENPDQRIHLLGHSMGGVIACATVARAADGAQVDSLILSAPAFAGKSEPGKLEVGLIRLLAKVSPGLSLPNRLNPSYISRDPGTVQEYCSDDLVHDRVTPRWFLAYRKTRDQLLAHPEAIAIPTLTLLPEGDELVAPDVTRHWQQRLQGAQHRLRVFPGAYHEVFNEPDAAEQALTATLEHLAEHAPSDQRAGVSERQQAAT
ncbi:alpha/beta hydrolase [Microbulbifer sp. Q7]|uniref:alpha/beta hydrolase n=1 Tax=Microbulbifer sp. Q7 TaxID=1785091 RepID=UPI00082A69F7|nr:alpha/beta hydrolase [Microbulbifer sp. Q7]